MKVLHVDTGREWRGGQTQMLHLLAARRDPVVVAPDAPIRARLESMGLDVRPVAFRGAWWGFRALADIVGDVKPDLIAAHTSHAHGHALLAGGDRPVVVHRRVDFVPGRDPLTRRKYAGPAGYVAVSEAIGRILQGAGVGPDRIAVVPDGVDPAPFQARHDGKAVRRELGIPEDAWVVGAVGALVPHKGHRHLVEALAWLDGRGKRVWGVVAGEGPRRGELEALAKKWDIASQLRLLGARDDVPRLLSAFDVFCQPSVEEGMGQAVVEAMVAGVPVVVTGAGGLPEVVEDMRTGLVVPPGDGAALSRALLAALRGRERALERAEAARQAAQERFSVQRMVGGTAAAYARFAGNAVPVVTRSD